MADTIEISVQDLGDNVTINIYELGAGGTTVKLDDLTLVVDRGLLPQDPVAGVNQINLPAAWIGKRIRVTRNAGVFAALRYTRNTDGILLLGDDECQPEEEWIFSNY